MGQTTFVGNPPPKKKKKILSNTNTLTCNIKEVYNNQ